MDVVGILREQLDPELVKLVELAQSALPHLDTISVGSLLLLYAIEVAITCDALSRAELADYLRTLAAHLELGATQLPSLTAMRPGDIAEPAF